MENYSKELQTNTNTENRSLEEIKAVLLQILPQQIVSEIMKVLPMYSPMTTF